MTSIGRDTRDTVPSDPLDERKDMSWELLGQIVILMTWSTICINSLKLRKGDKGEVGGTGASSGIRLP